MSTTTTPSTAYTTDPVPPSQVHEALGKLASSLQEGGKATPAQTAEVLTRVVEFLQLNPSVARGGGTSLEFLLDVTVPVSAELGHVTLPLGKVLELGPGSVVELDREVSHPVDLTVCGVPFARGEVVVVEDRFAIRIKELLHTRGKKGSR